MFKHLIFLFLFTMSLSNITYAQNDPVLFTVEDTPVHVSEFDYIYSKSKIDTASYSRASLNEYLELYKNFKLKVRRAKEMKLDTIPSLQKELAGYRKQLANSYLVDKEVTDKLIEEAYQRSLNDINFSHIMIALAPDASEKDVKIAEQRIATIQKNIKEGKSFEELARSSSDDKNTSPNGGSMGYLAALFPDGFYDLESAVYNTPINGVSEAVRTVVGLHLVKVNSKREARGQMEVAHILVRVPKGGDQQEAKDKINSIYAQLQAGAEFTTLAKEVSEDTKTAAKGGYIGFIGVRHPFEDSAFSIEKDGDYATPMQSSIGWHIIKRINKKPVDAFEIAKRRIQTKMQESQKKSKFPKFNRLNNARNSMIERIKREGNYQENPAVLRTFISSLDSSFVTYKWKAPKKDIPQDQLFTLGTKGDYVATLGAFMNFCQRNSKRMRVGKRMERTALVEMLYTEFLDDNCIQYEETQLEQKYPEFKSLMREYEEGILLFEATKILVWDKASKDSVGLNNYFNSHRADYQWNERAVVGKYTIPKEKASMVASIKKKAKKCSADKLLDKVNKKEKVLSREEKTYELHKSKFPEGLDWKINALSEVNVNKRNQVSSFLKVEEILPVSNKSLKDARGFVIADYQNYLEKAWIKELKTQYKVNVNQDVFEGLIK